MADKQSAAVYGVDHTIANVTTVGSIPPNQVKVNFDDATPDTVELSAALERAKLQILDYFADQA